MAEKGPQGVRRENDDLNSCSQLFSKSHVHSIRGNEAVM